MKTILRKYEYLFFNRQYLRLPKFRNENNHVNQMWVFDRPVRSSNSKLIYYNSIWDKKLCMILEIIYKYENIK